jgi:hypothetical protein
MISTREGWVFALDRGGRICCMATATDISRGFPVGPKGLSSSLGTGLYAFFEVTTKQRLGRFATRAAATAQLESHRLPLVTLSMQVLVTTPEKENEKRWTTKLNSAKSTERS